MTAAFLGRCCCFIINFCAIFVAVNSGLKVAFMALELLLESDIFRDFNYFANCSNFIYRCLKYWH